MNTTQFKRRHLHYQVLYEFALLEYELEMRGKSVPTLPLKEPKALLKEIRIQRQALQ